MNDIIQNFGQLVARLDQGDLHRALSDSLVEIVGQLHDARDKGAKPAASLVLTLKFTMVKGEIEIAHNFKTAMPERPGGRDLMWSTPDNRLTPNNPRQQSMDLRVASETREVR